MFGAEILRDPSHKIPRMEGRKFPRLRSIESDVHHALLSEFVHFLKQSHDILMALPQVRRSPAPRRDQQQCIEDFRVEAGGILQHIVTPPYSIGQFGQNAWVLCDMFSQMRHAEGNVPGFVLGGESAYRGRDRIRRMAVEEPEQR
jgi:hypothetical protein